jgi:peptidoglycan hydrolase-like protein with peptidoglycan-binding domain
MTTVDLSHVVYAAHVDPPAAQGHTSYKQDVLPVEKALQKKGLLDGKYVDGSYGTVTIDAYSRWQKSLGYSGSDADGIPGITTLTKLGKDTGLFTVTRGSTPPPSSHGKVPISVTSVTYGKVKDASLSKEILPKVFKVMGITDATAQGHWKTGIMTCAKRESGYNLNAVNTWDSNAKGPIVGDGHPQGCSRGLMQTIPSTFAANHQSGTSNDIYDGVANVCAAMNYVMARYHVARDGHDLAAKVQQFDPNRPPKGY